MLNRLALPILTTLAITALVAGCGKTYSTKSDTPPDDEAKRRGETAENFRYGITKDHNNFFAGMDVIAAPAPAAKDGDPTTSGDLPIYQLLDLDEKAGKKPPKTVLYDPVSTPNEILGRNTWMAWCGGNEGFWDWLAKNSYGFLDFLKVIDSRERPTRFAAKGLINEPGMRQSAKPDQWGLWIDEPLGDGSGKIIESIYGRSSGVIGLRLFPNPDFDEAAQKRWDAKRFYTDASYYNDPNLIRPYRVGMSCAFCHASYHPLNPPANVAEPRWENISGSIGAQYLRIRAVVGNLLQPDNVVYHILDSQPPGTVDTSLVASDNINNPNAMNSIFCLKQRVVRSFVNSPEVQSGGALTQPALWGKPDQQLPAGDSGFVWKRDADKNALVYRSPDEDRVPKAYWDAFQSYPPLDRLHDSTEYPLAYKNAGETGWLLDRVNKSNQPLNRYVPRILFDGADSIGGWGALARVYLNIGTYWEQWIRLHNSLVGFEKQQPFRISDCVDHSVYWQATQERVAPLRDYFLKITPPMPLLAARGGESVERPVKPATAQAAPAPEAAALKLTADKRALHIDVSKLAHGRRVFAHNCIVCHSSIQPLERQLDYDRWAALNEPWDHDPGRWLEDEAYRTWAEKAVEKPEFWRNNFLSSDYRVSIALIGTNPGRALATNGLSGDMWNDFTSATYKKMPSVGSLSYFNPFTKKDELFTPRHTAPEGSPEGGGGVGFYRVPSLVSIWATAPLLHNNTVGLFNNDPSVGGRLIAFDDAIRKLLTPKLRLTGSSYNEATPERLAADHGLIWRTTQTSYLSLPGKYIPPLLGKQFAVFGAAQRWYEALAAKHRVIAWIIASPAAFFLILILLAFLFFVHFGRTSSHDPVIIARKRVLARWIGYALVLLALVVSASVYVLTGRIGTLRLGPIPKGTPVNLISNINPDAGPEALKEALAETTESFARINSQHLTGTALQDEVDKNIGPALLKVDKVPDFVMDKGHYYKWFESMTDDDKDALIELLKTF